MDAVSVNHAEFGAKLLFEEGIIHTFVEFNEGCAEDEKIAKLIYQAVFWHSAYRLPENLDSRAKLFCDILRDADKVDILRVNVEFSFEEIYNVPLKALPLKVYFCINNHIYGWIKRKQEMLDRDMCNTN